MVYGLNTVECLYRNVFIFGESYSGSTHALGACSPSSILGSPKINMCSSLGCAVALKGE